MAAVKWVLLRQTHLAIVSLCLLSSVLRFSVHKIRFECFAVGQKYFSLISPSSGSLTKAMRMKTKEIVKHESKIGTSYANLWVSCGKNIISLNSSPPCPVVVPLQWELKSKQKKKKKNNKTIKSSKKDSFRCLRLVRQAAEVGEQGQKGR